MKPIEAADQREEGSILRWKHYFEAYERSISSMHFYDSICFIYKNGHGQKQLGEDGMYHG